MWSVFFGHNYSVKFVNQKWIIFFYFKSINSLIKLNKKWQPVDDDIMTFSPLCDCLLCYCNHVHFDVDKRTNKRKLMKKKSVVKVNQDQSTYWIIFNEYLWIQGELKIWKFLWFYFLVSKCVIKKIISIFLSSNYKIFMNTRIFQNWLI